MSAKNPSKRIYGKKHFAKVRMCIGPCGEPFTATREGERICPKCRRSQDPNDGSFLPSHGKVERLELTLYEVTNGEVGDVSFWRRYVIAQDADDAKRMARSGFLAVGLAVASLRVKSCLPCNNGMISDVSDSGLRVPIDAEPLAPPRHAWRRYQNNTEAQ